MRWDKSNQRTSSQVLYLYPKLAAGASALQRVRLVDTFRGQSKVAGALQTSMEARRLSEGQIKACRGEQGRSRAFLAGDTSNIKWQQPDCWQGVQSGKMEK